MSEQPIDVGEVITLTDEQSGDERDFQVYYQFDMEGRSYLVLVPQDQVDNNEEEYEVHIFRYDGSDVLEAIEDEEEWNMVSETFNTLMEEVQEGY
ncbi:DUF1292 domain-containing protein [Microaerobacter geothermalis]|uniref:DUF1292 domain-containing protein n=1 Tax=Microaerobacter geothermalis TaxID=674972 RepID=UPI001F16C711|nr:DUF1292 domain-containing protein [Microaerobacter geothermalis]MCF6093995.1 DUF1292 domain-containing protein [Microaerobacter geothermalis]